MTIPEAVNAIEIGLIYGMVAIGIFLAFRVIDFPDMTCDGSFVLGAAISGVLIKSNHNPWLALAISTLGGAAAGLATGIIHAFFKVSSLLAGILSAFILYSINLRVMGGIPNIALPGCTTIFSGASTTVVLAILCSTVASIFIYLLATDFGLGIRSVGQNKMVAASYGVNVSMATTVSLMISNALIALGGAVFNQHQCFVDISQGIGTLVIGLAAIMIGEKLLPSRSCFIAIPACVIGSIAHRFFLGFALHGEVFGLQTQDLNLVTGLLIVVAVSMPKLGRGTC